MGTPFFKENLRRLDLPCAKLYGSQPPPKTATKPSVIKAQWLAKRNAAYFFAITKAFLGQGSLPAK
jgi:hypothetical protein